LSQSILKTTRFRILFAAWWLIWGVLHTLVLINAGYPFDEAMTDSAVSNGLLAATLILLAISLQYYTPQHNSYVYLFPLCTALSVVWLFTSRFFLYLMLENEVGYETFFSQTLLLRGAIGFLLISHMALIAVLFYTIQDRQEVEQRKSEAEKLSREAELNNLRQQLQPHFLFNSLNSINALIGLQPQRARAMVQQLSDFLRGTLKKDQKEWISLDEELAHLQLYLEIEKVRFGHRLNTVVHNDTTGAQLPLMLLQPVVENAIKFGLYDTTGDITISINARREDSYLVLQVANPFDPETTVPQKGTGFGLRSVQRRLSLLFARPDLLQTKTIENIFTTTIKIPQP
jgi:sensor histidine kinase YesM